MKGMKGSEIVDVNHREEILTFVHEFLEVIGTTKEVRLSSKVYGIEILLSLDEDGTIFIH